MDDHLPMVRTGTRREAAQLDPIMFVEQIGADDREEGATSLGVALVSDQTVNNLVNSIIFTHREDEFAYVDGIRSEIG